MYHDNNLTRYVSSGRLFSNFRMDPLFDTNDEICESPEKTDVADVTFSECTSTVDLKHTDIAREVVDVKTPNAKCKGFAIMAVVIIIGVIIAVTVVTTWNNDDKSEDETTPAPNDGLTPSTAVISTSEPNVPTYSWLSWGKWTECSATCGTGIHKRYRLCEGGASCLGDYIDRDTCVRSSCPVYGKWTTWSSWGSCDATCGGGIKVRERHCNKNENALDCVGDLSQQKICSNWSCPDCNRPCDVGILNAACDTCICEHNVITGRVLALSTGNHIGNAIIFASSTHTRELGKSNSTGFFTLNSTCDTMDLLVVRDGFVDTYETASNDFFEIEMEAIVLPHMTEQPQSKQRLVGENVSFCCEAKANPSIEYYEWFKDSILLPSNLYSNENQLVLSSVDKESSGTYQCRANSPEGALFSSRAVLTVKENMNDFCSDALIQKTIALPEDCIQNNTNTSAYEVGDCAPNGCRSVSTGDENACSDDQGLCCSIRDADIRTVQCSNYEIPVVVVKSCGCSVCLQSSLTIKGTASSVDGLSPLKFGQVWVDDVFKAYTSSKGTFSFQVSKKSTRISINVIDTDQIFLPSLKVIDVPQNLDGILNIEIKMLTSSPPTDIDPSVDNVLFAGTTTDTPVVQLFIPSNVFHRKNGSLYNGTVQASLTFLDPTNISTLENIPGVFQTIDEEGEVAHLASLGVFNMHFSDDTGQPLVMSDVVDLSIPNYDGENASLDFKLWRLSTVTGNWEYVAPTERKRRRKRQITDNWSSELDGSLLSGREWYNYDSIYEISQDQCFFKLKLFKDVEMKVSVPENDHSVNIETHYIRNGILQTVKNWIRSSYIDGYCATVICEDTHSYISLYHKGRIGYEKIYAGRPSLNYNDLNYEIMDNDLVLKIQMTTKEDGPFFLDESICIASNKHHLLFHYGYTDESYIVLPTLSELNGKLNNSEKEERKRLSRIVWYPKRTDGFKVCHVKVRVVFLNNITIHRGQSVKIKVVSEGGTHSAVKTEYFGTTQVEIEEFQSNQSYCLEYKCSGDIPEFLGDDNNTIHDYTHVHIQLVYPMSSVHCNITNESSDLVNKTVQPTSNDSGFRNTKQVGIESGVYHFFDPLEFGPQLGLYKSAGIIETAMTLSEQYCISGILQGDQASDHTAGVAVEFTCSNFP